MSVTFGLAKSRHFYHILLYMSMCIFVYIFFYINNTTKGNTSLMLNKLLLLLHNLKKYGDALYEYLTCTICITKCSLRKQRRSALIYRRE